jgi:hypothetical protein
LAAHPEELHRDGALDSPLEVGVLEHDEWSVAAQLERQALELLSRHLHDPLADIGRAGEADLPDDGMRQKLVADEL